MTDMDLGALLAAAAADPRPATSTPDDVPGGDSPVDQAVAGYVMAVNLVMSTAEADQDLAWRWRRKIYAKEIARLQAEGGTVDPVVIDTLNRENARAELNDRYYADLKKIAQAGYERIFEIIAPLTEHLALLTAAPTRLREAGISRTELLMRVASAVDEINAQTQRLIDQHCPGATVADFLAARRVDTTVPLD
ncbi:hypothetical protein [Mycobacterium noviomagense]|uniref:Uncharacterized protein n=1 Tax=Mycobacterium noviomagense TaxID=459858 RepID=A0A7I7PDU3_9MYCO|nr:hypothetical protein [Mycobacterium noviomagense]ORB11416.1 hypothetical protein BST37_19430 [Mycobacterium noviomagense]BBY06741.1 hypothetical protein MNVI_20590 [Mycobacterium noviomagense]